MVKQTQTIIPLAISELLEPNLDMIEIDLRDRVGGTEYIDFLDFEDFNINNKEHKIVYGIDMYGRFFMSTKCIYTSTDTTTSEKQQTEVITIFQRYTPRFEAEPLYVTNAIKLYGGVRASCKFDNFKEFFEIINGKSVKFMIFDNEYIVKQI